MIMYEEKIVVGAECMCYPVTFNVGASGHRQLTEGKITYVNRRRRWAQVEFKVDGGKIVECFPFVEIMVAAKKRKR